MKPSENETIEMAIKNQVNSLYDLMRSENLEELEVKNADFYLFLKRKGKPKSPAGGQQQVITIVPESPESVSVAESAGETIPSPITGVFYRAPSSSSPPFVKEGDIAEPGKTLCIIEAMKVMNEIKAESRVKIVKILVENGKPVTSAQDLFQVEKA